MRSSKTRLLRVAVPFVIVCATFVWSPPVSSKSLQALQNVQTDPGILNIQLYHDNNNATISADDFLDNMCGAYYDDEQLRVVKYPRMLPCNESGLGKEPIVLHSLFGNPDLRGGGRRSPILKLEIQKKSMEDPDFSVIMSLYNAELSIEHSMPALFETMTGVWELIVILDACYDGSFDVIRRMTQSEFLTSTCVRMRIIEQPTAIWETSSDNLGLSVSNPKDTYVLVQPDMIITEKGWNERAQRAFFEDSGMFAISGRCGHSQDGNHKVGRCGTDFENPLKESENKSQLHVRETVNRGPLMLRATYAQELGFFDEQNFFLEGDDHDLCRRAWEQGLKVAYLPIGVHAPLNLGARRQQNRATPSDVLERESAYKSYRMALQKRVAGNEERKAGTI